MMKKMVFGVKSESKLDQRESHSEDKKIGMMKIMFNIGLHSDENLNCAC